VADNQNSFTGGERCPAPQDVHLIEKPAHFDRERIPERVVHAKGAGAHGYFQVCKGMAPLRKQNFSNDPKKKTPVLQQTAVPESPCSNTLTQPLLQQPLARSGKEIFKTS
jgi:catalase